MSKGSKSSEKTVQTYLAPKNPPGEKISNEKQSGKSKSKTIVPPAKRLVSERSFNESNSDLDLSNIQHDLDSIKDGLEGVLKKNDLDKALSSLVKKSDIEIVVTNIVTKLMDKMKEEIDTKLREKLNKQTKAIEELSRDNETFRETIAAQRKTIFEMKSQIQDNEVRTKQAIQMSNYNEQYSRKFNIKVMNCPEKEGENLRDLFTKDIVKSKLNVDVQSSEIQAIHRIPTKKGEIRPIIVKMVNSEVKSKIMREKKNLPKSGVKLVDDVTKHNMGLITRLSETKLFENVWYYNGSVYGKTKNGRRMKFDLFDNIEERLGEANDLEISDKNKDISDNKK